jgi:hypothetical protein
MGVDYKGLINSNINAIDLCGLIQNNYGGQDFTIRFGLGGPLGGHAIIGFTENMSDEVKSMRIMDRGPHLKHRQMHVWTKGECATDYADVTTDPMTYVSLGHWGECREIINSLVRSQGGYVNDEATGGEWARLAA